jgi:hypothetical protein
VGGALELLRWFAEGAFLVLAVGAVFLASTVVFDTVHFLLHVFARSRFALLRRIGKLHNAHHRFLDRNLELQPEYLRKNLYLHVIPEFVTQIGVSIALLAVLPGKVVFPAMGLQTLVFLLILRTKGVDINHKPIKTLRAYRPMYFCVPEYHALHHVYPDSYFSSWIKTFDHLLGTGAELRERRIAMTGTSTPFGASLRKLVEGCCEREVLAFEPPESIGPDGRDFLSRCFEAADVLVLTHSPINPGDAETEPDSYSALIERFREVARSRRVPIEVWALASGSEDHGGAGRGAGPRALAKRYAKDGRVIYRHLLARTPPTEANAENAAKRALFGIRRGFNFVPIS